MKTAVRALGTLLLLAFPACTSARTGQFKAFAEAGAAWVSAVDALMIEAAAASVDADSAVLERTRPSLDEAERRSTVMEHDALLHERVVLLADLRRHAHLLESYFAVLAQLASTDAPRRGGAAAAELVASMGAISGSIRTARVGEAPVDTFSGAVVEISLAKFREAALESELRARAQVIERELDTQEAAMRAIADELSSDLRIILDHRERADVIDPYKGGSTLPAAWSRRRREILTAAAASGAAEAAVLATAGLKAAYVALVEGRLGGHELLAVLADVNQVLDLVELITE